jgi:hypothetical protein
MLALSATFVLCGGTVTFVLQRYDGPPKSRDGIAIIRASGVGPTELVAIDGEPIRVPLERDNRLHVEVLPGVHDVDVAAPTIGLRHIITVRLLAEAGKVYRVEVWAPPSSQPPLGDQAWSAHAYEVDRDTDARRGIADAPPAPPPPAPDAG